MRCDANNASSTLSAAKAATALRLARRLAVLRLCSAMASRQTSSSLNSSSGQMFTKGMSSSGAVKVLLDVAVRIARLIGIALRGLQSHVVESLGDS
eukprot:3215023-Pleurochrysis_carterae.AAC.2